jgi:hypothetical protein
MGSLPDFSRGGEQAAAADALFGLACKSSGERRWDPKDWSRFHPSLLRRGPVLFGSRDGQFMPLTIKAMVTCESR